MGANTRPEAAAGGMGDIASRLIFLKNLQATSNRIHATANLDELLLDLPQEICKLFNADRLTLYVISGDGRMLVSRVKTGLDACQDI